MLINALKCLLKDKEGVTAIEYAIIGVVVVGIIIGGFAFIGDLLTNLETKANEAG